MDGVSDRSFIGNAVGKTSSSLFISASGGNPSVDDYDSLYFALKLTDNDLSLKTTFEIAYDGNRQNLSLHVAYAAPGLGQSHFCGCRLLDGYSLSQRIPYRCGMDRCRVLRFGWPLYAIWHAERAADG